MPKKVNYPPATVTEIEPDFIGETLSGLGRLYRLPKPKNDKEVQERVTEFFRVCQQEKLRPGIEMLSMALGVTRQTLYLWEQGVNCSPERREIIRRAKSLINSLLEQAVMQGKISPPSGIFLLKNWCGYKDTMSIEQTISDSIVKTINLHESPAEIIRRRRQEPPELPELPEFDEM